MNISADMTDKIKHLQKGDCMVNFYQRPAKRAEHKLKEM